MNYPIQVFVFIPLLVILSCMDTSKRSSSLKNKAQTRITATKSSVHKDADTDAYAQLRIEDSVVLNKMKEPNIASHPREVFRFIYYIPYNQKFFLRVEQLEDSTYLMTSKFYLPSGHNAEFPHATIPYEMVFLGDYIKGDKDSFIYFAIQQPLTKQDWKIFKATINGSYYWALNNPMEHLMVLDPHALGLSSKSLLPHGISRDTLFYQENYVAIPDKGSYTNAYNFLAKKSKLPQKLGINTAFILIGAGL